MSFRKLYSLSPFISDWWPFIFPMLYYMLTVTICSFICLIQECARIMCSANTDAVAGEKILALPQVPRVRHNAWRCTGGCLQTMSVGRFSWRRLLTAKTKSEVRINSGCANISTTNFIQKLPENELAIVSKTKENTSVEDRVMETNSKAVRGLIHILPTL